MSSSTSFVRPERSPAFRVDMLVQRRIVSVGEIRALLSELDEEIAARIAERLLGLA